MLAVAFALGLPTFGPPAQPHQLPVAMAGAPRRGGVAVFEMSALNNP